MQEFNNLDDLLNQLQKDANRVLRNEPAKIARKEMQKQVQEKVYNVYEPVSYERRGYNDGLIDADNVEIGVQSDDTIYIENIAYDGNVNVPLVVESGNGFWDGAPDVLTKGRKFTQGTIYALSNSDQLEKGMKDGMNRLGYDARLN